ncbi:histidine phosphatase family protein [Robertmurraya yapensis]|uniref:Histidine phosphatase family protein n=2 Tax=Bacillaceae TaxID=186817 RepID=A0A3S0K535_9BACI|nr:histidine phosphatase family protein [Bacillus yapensis]RTR35772.1 histidine phosphatase family protein [Bacillus yapensis]TKS98574.1 histidine phosphatase family protein [Bacillus yapensis]
MKYIYLIRHCEADGQAFEATLTETGIKQANDLDNFFVEKRVERIISSPYKRAVQSIQPLAERLKLDIELEDRLTERVLSSKNLPDWYEKLQETFEDFDLKFDGGESSHEAMNRIVEVIEEVVQSTPDNVAIVTHGNLMALLLKHFHQEFSFNDWKKLSNPDVYLLKYQNYQTTFKRIWK